jgi:hypothetical protein
VKGGKPASTSHNTPSQATYLFVGLIATIGVVLAVGIAAAT